MSKITWYNDEICLYHKEYNYIAFYTKTFIEYNEKVRIWYWYITKEGCSAIPERVNEFCMDEDVFAKFLEECGYIVLGEI